MNKILPHLLFAIFIPLLLLIGGNSLQFEKPKINLSKQITAINLDKEFFQFVNLGVRRVISSLTWINTMMESDIEKYHSQDLNNWMFTRLDLITELDPYFKEAYWFGGQYLSVIKDDMIGAEKIFLKGLSIYPDDYYLNYYIGSMYLTEIKDESKAFKHYSKIYRMPEAPEHIKSLTAKLYRKEGYEAEANALIYELYERAPEGSPLKEKYKNLIIDRKK